MSKYDWQVVSDYLWEIHSIDIPVVVGYPYESEYRRVLKYVKGIQPGMRAVGRNYTVEYDLEGYRFWKNSDGKTFGEDLAICIQDIDQFVCCLIMHMSVGE